MGKSQRKKIKKVREEQLQCWTIYSDTDEEICTLLIKAELSTEPHIIKGIMIGLRETANKLELMLDEYYKDKIKSVGL
jgi:hypothetical protein